MPTAHQSDLQSSVHLEDNLERGNHKVECTDDQVIIFDGAIWQ